MVKSNIDVFILELKSTPNKIRIYCPNFYTNCVNAMRSVLLKSLNIFDKFKLCLYIEESLRNNNIPFSKFLRILKRFEEENLDIAEVKENCRKWMCFLHSIGFVYLWKIANFLLIL